MASLADRAILVTPHVSMYMGRRRDKSEGTALAAKAKAIDGVARVYKMLLPTASSLDDIHKYAGTIRTFIYKNTLPWGDNVRIMKSSGFIDFQLSLSKHTSEFDRLVQVFIAEYAQHVSKAKLALGTLFKASDYPDVGDLASKFKVEVNFTPISTDVTDWRVDLGDEQIAEIQKSFVRQQRVAQQEMFERIYSVAENAHARLSDPKAVFRDSLVKNAEDLLRVLPALDITNDPRLAKLAKDLRVLTKHNPSTLRKDPLVRRDTAKAMKSVMSKMNAYMGA